MKRMATIQTITRIALFMALALPLVGFTAIEAAATLTAKANHDHISIDFFYHGSEVSISGECDPDTDLIVKVASADGHQALKEKGKVAGMWMNTGDLKLENTPNLYFVRCSKKMADIICAEDMEKNVIGYPALEKHVEMSCKDAAERAKWFKEFVGFKEAGKLYTCTDGGFTFNDNNGKHGYYMKFDWPYQATPGDYFVTVYAVRGGKVIEQATSKVQVEQVGAVKGLAGMAKNQGALYGIISIVAALVAGFGVGLVFGKGGGAH